MSFVVTLTRWSLPPPYTESIGALRHHTQYLPPYTHMYSASTPATRLALDKELEHITSKTDTNITFDFLDMKLQEKIERSDKKKGNLIRHMKLTAGILATNGKLVTIAVS